MATVVLLSMTLQACTAWVPEPGSAPAAVSKGAEKVRVVLGDGSVRVFDAPRIRNGYIGSGRDSVLLSDIAHTDVRRFSATKTAVAIVALGVTVAIVASLGGGSGPSAKPSSPPPSSTTISCPVVYSWDGHQWILDSGTFGGAIVEALQRTDVDNLLHVKPHDGVMRLKLANILDETEHVDALSVVAVDHDRATTIAPDFQGRIHAFGTLAAPVTARGFDGANALARVRNADGWNWESEVRIRDTSRVSEVRDGIELAFIRPAGATRAHLLVDGNNSPWSAHLMTEMVRAHGTATQAWYDSLNARPEAARALGMRFAGEAFLGAAVQTANGWTPQGLFWEAGPEVVKRQVLEVDLTGVVGDTVRVRLQSAPSFWLIDRVAMAFGEEGTMTTSNLPLTTARDLKGRDVRHRLASIDSAYFTMLHGDAAELTVNVPEIRAGQARSYMLRSNGWYKLDSPMTGVPNVALLHQIATENLGISKAAVARMNEALRGMNAVSGR